ncbi:hypothetical protein LguiA_017899 [Lonicera macranthoides]
MNTDFEVKEEPGCLSGLRKNEMMIQWFKEGNSGGGGRGGGECGGGGGGWRSEVEVMFHQIANSLPRSNAREDHSFPPPIFTYYVGIYPKGYDDISDTVVTSLDTFHIAKEQLAFSRYTGSQLKWQPVPLE